MFSLEAASGSRILASMFKTPLRIDAIFLPGGTPDDFTVGVDLYLSSST
jgi:hypothetical protein